MFQPYVLEIKGNSLDDGPGIRTTIFFKGCPLNCVWCHNPESKSIENELSFDKDACIGCGKCEKTCKNSAIDFKKKNFVDRNKCQKCFECVTQCPSKARTSVGTKYDVDYLFEKVAMYKTFYKVSGGGVTVSGGEATLFPEFVGAFLKKCKENDIHTLLETCGMFNYDKFEEYILPYIDTIYYDIKIIDAENHKKYCGADNKIIKENFAKLREFHKIGKIILEPRVPLIPEITDTHSNIHGIACFLEELGTKSVELLPYNPTWIKKNEKIGVDMQEKSLIGKTWQTSEQMKGYKKLLAEHGIEAK